MENLFSCVLGKNQIMKKSIFIALAVLAGSTVFAQKKLKQPPPPPPPVADVKEVPPPPPPPPPAEPPAPDQLSGSKVFFDQHPDVKSIDRNNNEVRIWLKSGKEELFDLNKEEDVKKLKDKYGELPAPPPPPPAPPAPRSAKHITQS